MFHSHSKKYLNVHEIYICIVTEHDGDLLNIILLVPTVTIVSNPVGTPVSGSTNTFDYPILSNVTLTCMVTPSDGGSTTFTVTRTNWNTTGCFTNVHFKTPTCFPTGKTTQNVTGNNLLAEDAGTITCTVTIDGVNYTSGPLTLRISGNKYMYKYAFIDIIL